MSQTDPIADMFTRVRNATHARHPTVEVPHSKLKGEIARLLKREGFIADYTTEAQGARRVMRVYLKYGPGETPVIHGLRRMSRSGCRRYASADRLPRVQNGIGLALLTTSAGVKTDREARKARLGGEVLGYVW